MKVLLSPFSELNKKLFIDPDKSISIRAIIFSALARGQSILKNISCSDDVLAAINIARQLGVKFSKNKNSLIVNSPGFENFTKPKVPLWAGESGTTLRLFIGLLSALPFKTRIAGEKSLMKRPMDRIINPLKKMGAKISISKSIININPSKLRNFTYISPIASAQVKSSLILASLLSNTRLKYIEKIKTRNHTEIFIKYLKGRLKPFKIFIPKDVSSAAFFIVAGLFQKKKMTLKNIGLNPTRLHFLTLLKRMGAKIKIYPLKRTLIEPIGRIEVYPSKRLKKISMNFEDSSKAIDELPILLVAGLLSGKGIIIRGALELRVKESDRLKAMIENLKILGINLNELKDGVEIKGNALKLPDKLYKLRGMNDHRIVMSVAILANVLKLNEEIDDAQTVKKSFPNFWKNFRGIRFNR